MKTKKPPILDKGLAPILKKLESEMKSDDPCRILIQKVLKVNKRRVHDLRQTEIAKICGVERKNGN